MQGTPQNGRRYQPSEVVDFVIVGAGSAGGVVARELSRAGASVVVLEQGPYLHEKDFTHDELAISNNLLTNNPATSPNMFRANAKATATPQFSVQYGRMVGGGSVHFTANFWRFHEIDFIERSKKGPIAGTGFDDWPITYADLEPYYTMVDQEIGISGLDGASPFEPHHSKPYPVPPLPIKSGGVLAERGAKKMGWTAFPSPMAILSTPYRGRSACVHCGFCEQYGCEVRAKSSALASMIPEAELTGRCEIRPSSYVRKVEIDAKGHVTGVIYFDAAKREVLQRASHVVLCANGAETPRLLLMSKSNLFPQGLANTSGIVGKHLMFNGESFAGGVFEHEINGFKGVAVSRVVHDFYELTPSLGIHGGGGMDFRGELGMIGFGMVGLGLNAPTWGSEYKRLLHERFTKTVFMLSHTTTLPVPANAIDLDPAAKDAWGLPAIRVTYTEHPNDVKLMEFFQKRGHEWLQAAGAKETWLYPLERLFPSVHLLGTCRMGNDPTASVVDKWNRAHDVPGLSIVDGSSFVTSGRGQPTMTIQALAFRAASQMIRDKSTRGVRSG
jgi:choline dehydrogenase-like flavoprotein